MKKVVKILVGGEEKTLILGFNNDAMGIKKKCFNHPNYLLNGCPFLLICGEVRYSAGVIQQQGNEINFVVLQRDDKVFSDQERKTPLQTMLDAVEKGGNELYIFPTKGEEPRFRYTAKEVDGE